MSNKPEEFKRDINEKNEEKYLIIGAILGAALGFLGNIAASYVTDVFGKPSKLIFALAFLVYIIYLFKFLRN